MRKKAKGEGLKEMWTLQNQVACFGDEYTLDHSDAVVTVGLECTFFAYFGKI